MMVMEVADIKSDRQKNHAVTNIICYRIIPMQTDHNPISFYYF